MTLYFAACLAVSIVSTFLWAVVLGSQAGAEAGAAAGRVAGAEAGRESGLTAAVERLTFKPALAFRNERLKSTSLAFRELPLISYGYDKREQCAPKLGTCRFVYYAWTSVDEHIPIFPIKNVDAQRPGVGLEVVDLPVTIESGKPLPPGDYELQISARCSCLGEPGEQPPINSKRLPFSVRSP